jgi:hypothetical protein
MLHHPTICSSVSFLFCAMLLPFSLVNIYDMHGRQEKVVDEAAAEAALSVLRSRLRVDGWVEPNVD